jgi:hypothetical protein
LGSWRDFLELLEELDLGENSGVGWWFRGQGSAEWRLEPALLRELRDLLGDYPRAHGIEFGATRRFRERAHLFSGADGVDRSRWGSVAWWAWMQHFGCPTRLLDWTHSPYVALYFAVADRQSCDSAVWSFPQNQVDTLVTRRHGRLQNYEIGEWGSVTPAIYPLALASHNTRSAPQQACFTVCMDLFLDHATAIMDVASDLTNQLQPFRLIVPGGLKPEFLSRLRIMNITAETLFPGLEGLGRMAAEYVRLRVWRTCVEKESHNT